MVANCGFVKVMLDMKGALSAVVGSVFSAYNMLITENCYKAFKLVT